MALKIEVRKASLEDAQFVAENMRLEDFEEVKASGYLSPQEAIAGSIDASDEARVILFNGDVALLYGVAGCGARPDGLRVGIPWVLTSSVVNRYPKAFVKITKELLPTMFRDYDLLVNFVDDRYTAAIKWLRILGFWVGEPEPFGKQDEPFRPFVMKKEDLCVRPS